MNKISFIELNLFLSILFFFFIVSIFFAYSMGLQHGYQTGANDTYKECLQLKIESDTTFIKQDLNHEREQ